jgi:uncharacterized repeat protein (TIGR01451 family)
MENLRVSQSTVGRAPRASALRLVVPLLLATLLVCGITLLLQEITAKAASGPLTVEIGAAYNLVVDSNVSSPSTYGPAVATVMGRFCNTGTQVLTNVWAYIGSYIGDTPGIYPARDSLTFDTDHPLYDTGIYSFTHLSGRTGLDDAARYVGDLAPGECKVQYWHFTYPRCSNSEEPPCSGTPVWGDSVKPDDDLWLEFDIWAIADDESTGERYTQSATRRMTMRNEISAMANKIEPNGNPGGAWFNTESDTVRPGELITSNGIHYEFGNVRHGFDNDGDFLPDFNAWAQPVGDPSYDPGCFRLIRTSGVLTISRGAGQPDTIVPFEDQLYFMNLPPDNNGVVGNVYYTFLALVGPCETALSPYQEVASGFDNEKFNGDYGAGVPPPVSLEPAVELDKSGNVTVTPGSTMEYLIDFHNAGSQSVGLPLESAPLVFSDTIPAGTTFLTESTSASVGVNLLYSTDNGRTWTTTVPASGVTHVQWWLADPLAVDGRGTITFSVEVDASPPTSFIENCADVRLDRGAPFTESCHITIISGTNTIGDWVWRDENRDAVQNDGATGIPNITVSLYWDDDGVLDSGEMLVMTTTTNASGYYTFTYLPDGSYLVQVDDDDPDLPHGYKATTPKIHAVTGLGITVTSPYLDADFGFGPTLQMRKSLVNDGGYEGREIVYLLTVGNLRPGGGDTVGDGCRYTAWADVEASQTSGLPSTKQWTDKANALGAAGPDGYFAYSDYTNALNQLAGTDYFVQGSGTISSVEAIFSIYVDGVLSNDYANAALYFNDDTTPITTTDFTVAQLNAFGPGSANQGLLTWDVTDERSWSWSDFAGNLDLRFDTTKDAGKDGAIVYLDALGFQITAEGVCPALDPDDVITLAPLTDTFNTALLQFVSAAPPATSVDTGAGVITWTNVGPVYPGESKSIRVTFEALEPSPEVLTPITNIACVTGGEFSDGKFANDDCDDASGYISPTGYISGVVWSDASPANGWQGTDGYESGTDTFIPGTTALLYQCVADPDKGAAWVVPPNETQPCTHGANDGMWSVVDTQETDANGGYLFDALIEGFYYVVISTTSIPDSPSQTGDPDLTQRPGVCTTCNNQWQDDPTAKLNQLYKVDPIDGTEMYTNVNFGYSVTASLFGYIWEDSDAEGDWDDDEDVLDNGTAGITVTLYVSDGSVYSTTQTNASGYYEFTGLVSDTYTITVDTSTLPSGGTWTQTGDPDVVKDNEHIVSVSSGEISGPHNFGYHRSGTHLIGDTVYADWNGDGDQDDGEEGIVGITVTLYTEAGAFITRTTTGAGGYYTFTGLVSGTYRVEVDESGLPAWWDDYEETQDPDEDPGVCEICDSRGTATVSSTLTSDLTIDFGYKPIGFGSLGDYVWYDVNGNGLQEDGEPGISDVTVELYEDSNKDGVIDPGTDALVITTTNANGYYLFENLPALTGTYGAYLVRVVVTDTDFPTDAYGNPYVITTEGNPLTRTLGTVEHRRDADFGFTVGGMLGDTVWADHDNDGIQDPLEPGLVVSVTLYTWTDGDGDGIYSATADTVSPILTKTTTVTGFYLFAGLDAGNYVVGVSNVPAGYSQTYDPDRLIVCDDTSRSDQPSCDHSMGVELSAGQIFVNADFGYRPPRVIGDYVWFDSDGDGEQDGTELGIGGVVITLTTPGGTIYTTTTDSDGYYSFSGDELSEDGTYTIEVYTPTLPSTQMTQTYDLDLTLDHKTTMNISSSPFITDVIDFGYRYDGPYNITGHVFFDYSGHGEYNDTYDENEDTGYGGITVYLWDDEGRLVATTTTLTGTGAFTFTNLPDGMTFTVSVDVTSPKLSGMDLTASPNPAVRYYNTVTINGDDVRNQDFGVYDFIDFGDLPDSYGTTVLNEGAGHITGTLRLGSLLDSESDGQPSGNATGDGSDDADGIARTPGEAWDAGSTVHITATVTGNNGYLVGYFDWNGDGDFADANERVIFGDVVSGTNSLTVNIPGTSAPGTSLNARFRLYDKDEMVSISPNGLTQNGEIEDYQWPFGPTAVTLSAFTAAWNGDEVLVAWETTSEVNTVGFNVWRNETRDGGYVRVNDALIPAASLGGVWGGPYAFTDSDATPGTTYYYKLEELEVSGARNWYGPVSTSGDDDNPTALTLLKAAAGKAGFAALAWWLVGAVVVVGAGWVSRRPRRRCR